MNKYLKYFAVCMVLTPLMYSCNNPENKTPENKDTVVMKENPIKEKADAFISVSLKSDISGLSDKEKQMLPILFEIAQIMDDIYWEQTLGDKNEFLSKLTDKDEIKFANINYGPWERLNGNMPWVAGYPEKPKGANYYPKDMTTEEFEKFTDPGKDGLYTLIRRNDKGELQAIPYHEAFKEKIEKAAGLLLKAAELAEDPGLKKYLELRSKALLTDDYYESDLAWMDMKNNNIDFVVGPIENYEDELYNYKAAYESFILIKDKEWSEKLNKYAKMLPEMQKGLPVQAKYKAEVPGTNSDLGAYDVVYYGGDCNAGSKTIAINLPNDEKVHEKKGSRRLQLKNAMQAKFDNILVPISKIMIDEDQQKHIVFQAFFENTMFHETAHGLGIRNVIGKNETVSKALKELSTTMEEGKADILGLYFVTKLYEKGEFPGKDLMDNYVTFMASIFRSVRFGVSSSHGKANMLRYYYFLDKGAFSKNPQTGTYRVDFEKMKEAMTSLTEKILVIQGDGNYDEAKKWIDDKGQVDANLQSDLDRINKSGIPVDIVFEQGLNLLMKN